ncbi:hypothetical protein M2164_005889 [Streptomyces sp. SAI-208]|uniref:hypothetical protein n=1 Tax=Streptomyces sp. SAI-208 TaxID=2940550 RepID=UPI002474D848|nr:hypothetical protein [Streptomyces sp. SAI-208]MDH6610254.1 hypothetical protein [Streptomyces sp. SAI-208]
MTTPIICRPPSFPIRRILDCPTEGRRRRMAGRDHGPYYGPTLTCLGCGDSWSCGERLERPFRRAWRRDEIFKAKQAWDEAGRFTADEYADWLVAECAAAFGPTGNDVPLPDTPA